MKTKLERRCVGCGGLFSKSLLWQLVRVPSGEVIVGRGDRHVFGRSAYVCRRQSCLDLARKKKAWGRSLKTFVHSDLINQLNQLQAQLEHDQR